MTTSPSQEELAACLLPYKDVLWGRVLVFRIDSHLWIFGSPGGDDDDDRMVMEALELSALLARVDWRLWVKTVSTVYRLITYGVQVDEKVREEVGVSLEYAQSWGREVCEFLVTSSQNTTSSATFQRSKKLMLRACYDQGKAVDEIPVRIGRVYYRRNEAQLAHISELVSRQQKACQEARQAAHERGITTKPLYCGLRFRRVEIGKIDKPTQIPLLGYAAEMISSGICLSYLSPALIEVQEQHPHKFMDAMTKIFPLCDLSETQSVGGVSYLSLSHFSLAKAYPGVLSALRASSGVQKIDFTPNFNATATAEDKRWMWSWLVYGAFLRGSHPHRMKEISIHVGELDTGIIESITRILHGRNPVATLFNREGDDVPPETVSASRFALLDPSSLRGSSFSKWISDHPLNDLPVIERTTDWVSVLLPRWGQAWVHCEDTLSSRARVETAPQIESIPNVTLDGVGELSRESVVALLRMVGRGIRHLVVFSACNSNGAQRVDWGSLAREIISSCPDLKSLKLQGPQIRLTTLHCILDACASGSSRLERLHLECASLMGGCRSLPPLIEALSSRQHPAGRYLKGITLSRMPFNTMREPSAVPAFIAMLKENVTLERLNMSFRVQRKHRAQFVNFLGQLKPFNGERIDGMRSPRTILAFMSVIGANRGQDKLRRAIQQLDAHAVSVIFAFSASSFVRRVIVGETRT